LDKRQLKAELAGGKFDSFLRKYAPGWARKRQTDRLAMAATSAYLGADKSRKAINGWDWVTGDADSDLLPDLETLRGECRDLSRNTPIGRSAVSSNVISIVGNGLVPHPQLDRNVLNITDEEADERESLIKTEWRLWANTTHCDLENKQNFGQITGLVLRSVLDSGDTFALTPVKRRSGNPYSLKVQLVEADRVSNPDSMPDSVSIAGGIQVDADGQPIKCHILNGHPGNYITDTTTWTPVDFFGESGRRNIIHVMPIERIGQRRGVPYLAPVVEQLKQISRYTEAELMAAVVTSFFTVFVKSITGEGMDPLADVGGSSSDTDYKMGYGNMLDLSPDEDVTFADPSRPNKGYEAFELAITRQIGSALQIPQEILTKFFNKSYSAARASMLEFWRYVICRRGWLVSAFCDPIYELWFTEAVSLGRIPAPGFFSDPLIKQAYLGAKWVGPPRGMIDELKEIEGAERRVEMGVSTVEDEAMMLTGADWEKIHAQRVKEVTKRRDAKLEHPVEAISEFRR
jgi:lambda family phage portal protein